MSEPKFTPGPWHVYDARENAFAACDWQVLNADNEVVADVWCEEDANAQLIACAPEYYAVLDELVRKVGHDEDNLTALQILMRLNDIINRAEKLLAKARGEVQE